MMGQYILNFLINFISASQTLLLIIYIIHHSPLFKIFLLFITFTFRLLQLIYL